MEKPDLGSRGPDVSILSYHGNKFVSGLFWRPLSSQRQYMKEARKLGKEEHLDIVAIRHSPTVIQAGFVSKSQGAVKGMYSLASALSGQFDGDFLACWKVDEDRYALVATLDGAIVPGQDLVTTSTRPGTGSGSSLRAACCETHRSSFPKGSISPSRTSTSRNCSRRSACGATTASGNSPSACPPGSGRQWPCSVAW
ncbi:type 4b pilus protein PilO2 [Pseudomonas aeruginosa]|nr:type 4b pilus protein PilO2 [Pseudomonas aeruginosa]